MAYSLVVWVLLVLLVLVLMVVFKFKEIRHKVGLVIVVGFLLFFVFTFGHLFITGNVDITSFDGLMEGFKVYFIWLGSILSNLGEVTTYAVQQDWSLNATENLTAGTGSS